MVTPGVRVSEDATVIQVRVVTPDVRACVDGMAPRALMVWLVSRACLA